MKTILVTGGAGFLGSNLCRRLCREKHRVIAVDNLFSGLESNLAGLEKYDFNFIRHDINEKLHIDMPVDEIYHLACPASPPFYQQDPVFTAKTCFIGTLNMLELAAEKKATFLFSSTSEIYGEPQVHPQIESYRGNVNPTGIRSCYDEGKRIAESLCFDFMRQYGLKIKIIRIFNTYGINMRPDDGRVISNFIVQALSNRPLTVFGDGSQSRSFCYVDDLLDGMTAMMNSRKSVTGPINLGNPRESTMLNLAETIIGLCNSKSRIMHCELPADDPTRRRPDISEARKSLNFSPSIPLESGLKNTIDFFKKIL